MEQIYLYVKTHLVTGKKYFGQTKKDPYKYKGSGKMWLLHLQEHGNEVKTEVVETFTDRDKCKIAARKFSIDNNIVSSEIWMNMILETLGGGSIVGATKCRDALLIKYGKDYYSRIAKLNRTKHTQEFKQKLRDNPNCARGGKMNFGKIRLKISCPHCGTFGAKNTMSRWHFNNCKKYSL